MAKLAVVAFLALVALQAALAKPLLGDSTTSAHALLLRAQYKSYHIALNKNAEVNEATAAAAKSLIDQVQKVIDTVKAAAASGESIDAAALAKQATEAADEISSSSAASIEQMFRAGARALSPIYQNTDKLVRKLPAKVRQPAADLVNSFYDTYVDILDIIQDFHKEALEQSAAVAKKAISEAAEGADVVNKESNADIALVKSDLDRRIDHANIDFDRAILDIPRIYE